MPCEWITLPDGTKAIVKLAKPRRRRCSVCRKAYDHNMMLECDWKLASGKTCDALLCKGCAISGGADIDYCPTHRVIDTEPYTEYPNEIWNRRRP